MILGYNTLIVLAGTGMFGAACGLVGGFAVLRGRALLGDALAHAALPGIVLAFLAVGGRDLAAMLLGAFLAALVGVLSTQFLTRFTRLREDAAIGVVLSVFFGVGVALTRIAQNEVSGGGKAGFDSFIRGKTAGLLAEDLAPIGVTALLAATLVVALFKELKTVAFDAGFARALGRPAGWFDAGLTGLLALVVTIGIPAVGVLMVAALVVIPAAAARFWTDRLTAMLILSATFGALSGLVGTLLSASLPDLPAGPVIVLTGAVFFGFSLLAAPRRGLLAALLADWVFRRDLADRRTLLDLVRAEPSAATADEPTGRAEFAATRSRGDRGQRRAALARLQRRGLVDGGGGFIRLTEPGRAAARRLAARAELAERLLGIRADLARSLLADPSTDPGLATLTETELAQLPSELRRAAAFGDLSLAAKGATA
jgi:manganese/zinc/iron transport system permease protein